MSGHKIIEGLKQAIAFTRGDETSATLHTRSVTGLNESETMTRLVPVNCKTCSGTGRVEYENPYARLSDGAAYLTRECPKCEGEGVLMVEIDDGRHSRIS